MDSVILNTELDGLPLYARGKVRDIYALDEHLLFIASDRISAFDYVLASGIPDKGKVLTQLSLFWFDFLADTVANHLITAQFEDYPASLRPYEAELRDRSMIVCRAEMIPIECVVRGYLAGSGWKDYQRTGMICGIEIPQGLRESDKLPEPIFTPAIKATSGHDENIPFSEMVKRAGPKLSAELRDLSLKIYKKAAAHAAACGIIIADTKFEFGHSARGLVLADEVFTPDSSRFWPSESYHPGKPQLSYDKQYVRDYLESIHWNKQPPAPGLPAAVAKKTSEKYKQAYRQLAQREVPN